MAARRKSRNLRLPALRCSDLDAWAASLALSDAHSICYRLRQISAWWAGHPTKELIAAIRDEIPRLVGCLDFDNLISRVAEYERRSTRKEKPPQRLTQFAPEIAAVYDALVGAAQGASATHRERAEAWLLPIAQDAGADGDIEAATYFASRGRLDVVSAGIVKQRWLGAIRYEVARQNASTIEEAWVSTAYDELTAPEAYQVLATRGYVHRFFGFRDSEEDFIDSAFVRAVDWFELHDFSPWVENEFESGILAAPDGITPRFSWWFFHQLRSDSIARRAQGTPGNSWIYAFSRAGTTKDAPWMQLDWGDGVPVGRYFAMAAIFAFGWHRLGRPASASRVAEEALALLRAEQRGDGAWSLGDRVQKSSLLCTCAAVHAFAVCRPEGWRDICRRACDWIETQQDRFGYWSIEGGPAVMLTVLALDALALGLTENEVTFSIDATIAEATRPAPPAVEPVYSVDGQPWHDPPTPGFVTRSSAHAETLAPDLLLVVATETELRQVLAVMTPAFRKRKLFRIHKGGNTYYLGRLGVHAAAVLRCSMGAEGSSGALLSTSDAIRDASPRAVVMPGIAFGMNRERCRPADVIVARSIIPYESQRIGEDESLARGTPSEPSPTLLDRFRTPSWSFFRPDGSRVARHEGALLSGSKLVAKATFRDELLKQHPHAIGGEMEGAGVAAACHRNRVDWLIVKAVCDWGDGAKHDEYQEMAAAAAVDLCLHVFRDEHALDGIPQKATS